jgi:predicted metalloprotease with PDZ domain
VPIRQLDQASWIVECVGEAEFTVGHRVYAFDVSVRAAFFDATRGFFNGTGVCLRVSDLAPGSRLNGVVVCSVMSRANIRANG